MPVTRYDATAAIEPPAMVDPGWSTATPPNGLPSKGSRASEVWDIVVVVAPIPTLLAALFLLVSIRAAGAGAAPPTEGVYSVQLHVHGSASEGVGSVEAHTLEAREHGLDVLWWSDHDDILTSFRRPSRFRFEEVREPLDLGEDWTVSVDMESEWDKRLLLTRSPALREVFSRFTTARALEGERSLELRLRNPSSDDRRVEFSFHGTWGRHRRPLFAQVTVRIAVFPRHVGPNAYPYIRVAASEHVLPESADFRRVNVLYYLDNSMTEPQRRGDVFYVPLQFRPGEWNRYELPVTRDAVRGFPMTDGEDNALTELCFGMVSARGGLGHAHFDALSVEHVIEGAASFEKQRSLLRRAETRFPEVVQLQGQEISYLPIHLNEFSLRSEPVDYSRLEEESKLRESSTGLLPRDEFAEYVSRRVVEAIHAREGLVSYNHMYGTGNEGRSPTRTREEVLEHLLRTEVFGVDILEVGYRDRGGHSLSDHVWVWDRLALRGFPLIGTGVSDSHGGATQRLLRRPNNMVSWIYAASSRKADLLEGLRRGRVFFGDLLRFDGTLDVVSDHGFRMGQIVLTDRSSAKLEVRVEGLRSRDRVVLVESGERGPVFATSEPGTLLRGHRLEIPAEGPAFLRVEILQDGAAKVLSNPLHFVRKAGRGGIPPARAGVDVGGVVSRRVENVWLEGFSTARTGGRLEVSLVGRASNGRLELDVSDHGEVEVAFVGLEGRWQQRGDRVALWGLQGRGQIVISSR